MHKSSIPIPEQWLAQLIDSATASTALAVGVFAHDGTLLYANPGMRHLLRSQSDHLADVTQRLVKPSFGTVRDASPADQPIYEGWLTFGDIELPYQSVRGRIWRDATNGDRLLIIAEHDVTELARTNREITALNGQISNLQRDLTRINAEIKNKNAELAETIQHLRQLDEFKNEIIGIAAHDLRNPTASIYTVSHYLLDERFAVPATEQQSMLHDILEQAQYMLRLLDDLLNVSQIESGHLTLELDDLALPAFIETTIKRHNQLAARKDTHVVVERAPGTGTYIFADPMRLRQVMDNLIDNAVKYSPPNSTIMLSVDAQPSGWRISITDQGPGLSPEEQSRLFQPFGRARSQPTGGERSTGLGLAISRRIITEHGGTIGVDSIVGQGSTFWFTLPDEPPQQENNI